jgi:hypothetical protein
LLLPASGDGERGVAQLVLAEGHGDAEGSGDGRVGEGLVGVVGVTAHLQRLVEGAKRGASDEGPSVAVADIDGVAEVMGKDGEVALRPASF